MDKNNRMTIEEMVDCFRKMFSQAVAERSQDYGVVMEEAYNLWALLYYDLGIDSYTADKYLEDGIHLTQEGRQIYADALARLILAHEEEKNN